MVRTGRRRLLVGGSTLLLGGLAGCLNQEPDEDPSERGPLSIAEFVFAAEQPGGPGEYTEQPDATYARGETLWLYLELEGLAGESTDDGVEIDLEQRLLLEHEQHGTVSDTTEPHEPPESLEAEQLEPFAVQNQLAIDPEMTLGEYTLTVEFTDGVSGSTASESGTFHVVE